MPALGIIVLSTNMEYDLCVKTFYMSGMTIGQDTQLPFGNELAIAIKRPNM